MKSFWAQAGYLWQKSGFNAIFVGFADGGWQNLVMLIIACVLLYLGIVKKFEPLLLVGIAFGCLLSNLPLGGLYHQELWDNFMNPASDLYHSYGAIMRKAVCWISSISASRPPFPCLIFMGVGAMTDFGPLLSQPQEPAAGRCRTAGRVRCLPGRRAAGLYRPPVRFHRHHRRRGRPHRHFPDPPPGPELLGPLSPWPLTATWL